MKLYRLLGLLLMQLLLPIIAVAQCPAGPTPLDGGGWSGKSKVQGNMAVVSPGMNGTPCRLQVSLADAATTIAKSFVTDTSPRNEKRYRARFYFDTSELTGMSNPLSALRIFSAAGPTSPVGVSTDLLEIFLVGASSGQPTLRFLVGDKALGGKYQILNAALTNPLGSNRVEFDLSIAGDGTAKFRYWISAADAVTADATPTGMVSIADNTPWVGVAQANLGEINATATYRSNMPSTKHFYVDEFDSRRESFIGK